MEQKETLIFNSDIEVDGNLWISDDIFVDDKSIKETLTNAVGKATALGGEIFNDYENNKAMGAYSHAEGYLAQAGLAPEDRKSSEVDDDFIGAHAEGVNTVAKRRGSHAEGERTVAGSPRSHAEGLDSIAGNAGAHAEGQATYSAGLDSHAEGKYTAVTGDGGHTEGISTRTIKPEIVDEEITAWQSAKDFTLSYGVATHTEGRDTLATGTAAHAEGYQTYAKGNFSHAEGEKTEALANRSHAEGLNTQAKGAASHAEGQSTLAQGAGSHAGGNASHAQGNYSFAHGNTARATADYQAVFGTFNTGDSSALFVVGNGTSNSDKRNAFAVKNDGRATVGSNPVDPMDVTTKQYADEIKSIAQEALSRVQLTKTFANKNEMREYLYSKQTNDLDSLIGRNLQEKPYLMFAADNVDEGGLAGIDLSIIGTSTDVWDISERIESISVIEDRCYAYISTEAMSDTIENFSGERVMWFTAENYLTGTSIDVAYFLDDVSLSTIKENIYPKYDIEENTTFFITNEPDKKYVWDGSKLVEEKVVKTSVLNGKKFTFTGDSICAGVTDYGSTEEDRQCNYAKLLKDKYQIVIGANVAQGGATICDVNAEHSRMCISNSVLTTTFANAAESSDYIIIEGGVNDSFHYNRYGITLGSLSTSYNFASAEPGKTFYGALEKMFYELTTRYLGKKIGYIITHPITKNYSSTEPEETSFYIAVKKCCEKWGIPYLDLATSCPPFQSLKSAGALTDTDLSRYFIKESNGNQDTGWHPNKLGYETFYIPKIVSWLESL